VLELVLQTLIPTQQPTTIEVVEYQRVKNALPNGAPDLAAPENFYIRATSTYYLLFDTDTLPVDQNGNRHIHVDRLEYKTFEVVSQTGHPSRKLAEKFTEVFALWTGKKPMVTGSGSFSGFDQDIPQGQRRVDYLVRTIVEKVETHSEGKRRTIRTSRERHWSISGGGVNGHKPFLPPMDSLVAFEAGPHVRVDPIKYGYQPVVLPKPDDL
jgi:hypothetical protein